MSSFVDACQKEWGRLGVPEAVANEMAADLEADLAEAGADGVSPEEVLGNGFFDPESFAASWATERGIVNDTVGGRTVDRLRAWKLATVSVVCAATMMVGLAILVGIRHSSVSVAGIAIRRQFQSPVPGIFKVPGPFPLEQQSGALVPLGLIFLVAGLAGLGITLFAWRRRANHRQVNRPDRDIGMPSYL